MDQGPGRVRLRGHGALRRKDAALAHGPRRLRPRRAGTRRARRSCSNGSTLTPIGRRAGMSRGEQVKAMLLLALARRAEVLDPRRADGRARSARASRADAACWRTRATSGRRSSSRRTTARTSPSLRTTSSSCTEAGSSRRVPSRRSWAAARRSKRRFAVRRRARPAGGRHEHGHRLPACREGPLAHARCRSRPTRRPPVAGLDPGGRSGDAGAQGSRSR